MSGANEIPDPPPAGPNEGTSSDPFANPLELPPTPSPTGGYLGENDDEEVRKIRRRVSPFGKVMIGVVAVALAGTGYFLVKSARDTEAVEQAEKDGRAELEQILSAGPRNAETARRVREAYAKYPTGATEFRMSARRVLAAMHDPDSMPVFIDGLNDAQPRVRRQAALAIAEVGMPSAAQARDALARALSQATEVDKTEIAWAMVVAQDDRAWNTVLEQLSGGKLQNVKNLDDPPKPIFDAALVARLAGRDRLISMATNDTIGVRRIASIALSELATPDTFDALSRLSQDNDPEVARDAAIGLGRTGDVRAGQPITAFLTRNPTARDGVLAQLAQNSGAPGLGVVIASTQDPETRAAAVRILRGLNDPGAADVFLGVLRTITDDHNDNTLRNARSDAAFGLAEIGDERAGEFLVAIAQRALQPSPPTPPSSGQPAAPPPPPAGAPTAPPGFAPGSPPPPSGVNVNRDQDARIALDLLRKIPNAAARVKPQIVAMLADPHAEFMRTPLLLALAASGDASMGATALQFLNNPDAQSGAAVAVARLRYAEGISRLRAQIRRPGNLDMSVETRADEDTLVKRRNALRAVAWTRDASFAADLERIVEDNRDRALLREEAGHSLAAVADDRTLEDIANRAMDTNRSPDVRAYYLFALRGRSTPQLSNRLVQTFLSPGVAAGLMRPAAIAAGFGGDESTAALLRPLLNSNNGDVQLNAAVALILCGDESSAGPLLDALRGHAEFEQLLSRVFVTAGGRTLAGVAGDASAPSEPPELMPLTAGMFDDGRVYRRIAMATALAKGRGGNHADFPLTWLRLRLKSGWEYPTGMTPFDVRARLRQAAQGNDAQRRDMAFEAMRALGDRGSLLWLRRQGSDAGERARRVLIEMANPS